jgi:hypothetical protein
MRVPRGTLTRTPRSPPLSAEAFAVQFTRSREADERFRYAQDLLGYQVTPSDIAEVYDLAMKALIAKLERTRFAATSRRARCGRRRPVRATSPRTSSAVSGSATAGSARS